MMPQRQDVSAASLVLQPFVVLSLVLLAFAPPTPEQTTAADPLVQLMLSAVGSLGIPVFAAGVACLWWWIEPPRATSMRRALERSGAAILLVVVGLPLARVVLGPALPPFIPPEESARPGMLLGLGAGVVEEALFRLLLLPGLLAIGLRFTGRRVAVVVAVCLTSLAFAALHEVGPATRAFDVSHFFSRALVPGLLMSAVALWAGFPFVVVCHCAAHVLLPLLFE